MPSEEEKGFVVECESYGMSAGTGGGGTGAGWAGTGGTGVGAGLGPGVGVGAGVETVTGQGDGTLAGTLAGTAGVSSLLRSALLQGSNSSMRATTAQPRSPLGIHEVAGT